MRFLVKLLFPTKCEICGIAPEPLCEKCVPIPMPRLVPGFSFPVWSMAPLDPSLQKLMRAYKDDQILGIEKHLVELVKPNSGISDPEVVIAVPPRNQRNFRKRGFYPAFRLARKIFGPRRKIFVLGLSRQVEDQRELTGHRRRQNLQNAFLAKIEKGSSVVLFDDVLTTGSTLREMARAIEASGGSVLAACVLAETISDF